MTYLIHLELTQLKHKLSATKGQHAQTYVFNPKIGMYQYASHAAVFDISRIQTSQNHITKHEQLNREHFVAYKESRSETQLIARKQTL